MDYLRTFHSATNGIERNEQTRMMHHRLGLMGYGLRCICMIHHYLVPVVTGNVITSWATILPRLSSETWSKEVRCLPRGIGNRDYTGMWVRRNSINLMAGKVVFLRGQWNPIRVVDLIAMNP
ncbi:hypothetical protein TNCV_3752971 [Trichonephila clavipes]|nr:hypothetical protein TNCV_3752971 [Trichonephila clavipes]